MTDQKNIHLFSLYVPDLIDATWTVGNHIELESEDLCHRIIKVLRLDIGSKFILFDQDQHATVVVEKILKKNLVVGIKAVDKHQQVQPLVTFLLPLLKKEALEQAVYSLCELGVNQIQLVVTEKSRQQLMNDKEFMRLQKIMISAAEQSKHYAMTEIFPPKKLWDMDLNLMKSSDAIVFDPSGESFFSLHEKIEKRSLVLLVGPEGGLTQQEMQILQDKSFYTCALTSTTLRAVQAVVIGAGLFRLR